MADSNVPLYGEGCQGQRRDIDAQVLQVYKHRAANASPYPSKNKIIFKGNIFFILLMYVINIDNLVHFLVLFIVSL